VQELPCLLEQQPLKMNFHSFLIAVNQKVLYNSKTLQYHPANVLHNVSHLMLHGFHIPSIFYKTVLHLILNRQQLSAGNHYWQGKETRSRLLFLFFLTLFFFWDHRV
jgi:hypothetical protein